jgi:hypothetical protein
MPGSGPLIPFGHKLRMAPPPHHLAQGFLRSRPPVGPDIEMLFPSGPQCEDPLAAMASNDLDVPGTPKL